MEWTKELPAKSGWYFTRDEGVEPIGEGMIVWVGHNRSGVRHEGKFFYADEAFLKNREFFGPITAEVMRRGAEALEKEEQQKARKREGHQPRSEAEGAPVRQPGGYYGD